jgi:type II secretory pathway pseudopilin PulG
MRLVKKQSRQGFTRTELCVVLGVVGLMGLLVLPTLAREQNRDWRLVCLRRLSQLANAMAMYAADNRDFLAPNPDDGTTAVGHNWCPGMAGPTQAQEFNTEILRDPSRSLLINYLRNDLSAFKCPLDPRIGKYQGTNATLKGAYVPSARTVSLNSAVGTNPNITGCKRPSAGLFLDGTGMHTANKTFHCYARQGDFIRPGPAQTFTFIEEDPVSIIEGSFYCMGPNASKSYKIADWPLTSHGMAGAVAFADGHVEMHRWLDPRTRVYQTASTMSQPNSPDLEWLAQHASALVNP